MSLDQPILVLVALIAMLSVYAGRLVITRLVVAKDVKETMSSSRL